MENKQVSKEEFSKFIKNYPNLLKSSISSICEPPIRHFFDDSLLSKGSIGSIEYFFDKEVASITMDWMKDGKIDKNNSGKFWEYYIKVRGK